LKRIIVVGGGAAGLFAAMKAREKGASVTILEKNNMVGKKMLITGKGRCNITNAGPVEQLIKNIPGNGNFLYSAFHLFSNIDAVETFERLGLPTKTERGDRVFPQSDRALDVVSALERYLSRIGVNIKTNTRVEKLVVLDRKITGIETKERFFPADRVILATGGASYPGTGSTGDGYRMAQDVGHTIVPLKPSLVPLEVAEQWVKEIQGLALKNVEVSVWNNQEKLAAEFGEMLFTHFGLSGPVILSLSKTVTEFLDKYPEQKLKVMINLKPALTPEQIDHRIQRDFQKFTRKQLRNAFSELLPKSLIPVFVKLLPIPRDKPVHQVTREERWQIVQALRELAFTVTRPRPLSEAIVTAGGVSVKEINPKTMESKLIEGLFFAREVIDIDGFTGGYNLQAAYSTGVAAGLAAAE